MIAIIATQGQLAAALGIIEAGVAATTPERFEWAARFVKGDREALIRVLTRRSGRTPEQELRIVDIVRTVRELRAEGRRPTRERVAARLGRVSEDGELPGDFRRDVTAAGGWSAIRQMAD